MLKIKACFISIVLLASVSCTKKQGPEATNYQMLAHYTMPGSELGQVDGITIQDGGYSGLAFDEKGQLWTLTDRGPNLDVETRAGKPAKRFPVPSYHPHAQRIVLADSAFQLANSLNFYTSEGGLDTVPATGLPIPSSSPKMQVEKAVGANYEDLKLDAQGIDSEGIAFGGGSLWISDEYRPSIWQLDPSSGQLLARYTPTPSGPLDKPLPEILLKRKPNLGIEGLAFADGYLYASLQSSLSPPTADRLTPFVRILRLKIETGEVRMFAYEMDASTRKIGDLAIGPAGQLLVLEHGSSRGGAWSGAIYAVQLEGLNFLEPTGPYVEQFKNSVTALTSGILPANKRLYLRLEDIGWAGTWKKPEGLAVDESGKLYLINDNDFGLDSPESTGAAQPNGVETHLLVVGEK